MVYQPATHAGLQSLCTSPKRKGSVSSDFNDFEVGSIEKSGISSRYRTLNDEEQQRQADDIDKIIHGLKSQRRVPTSRPQSAKLRSSQVSVNESFSKASKGPMEVRSPQTTHARDSFVSTKAKSKHLSAEPSSPEPVSMKTQPVRESFQERVLTEIQKLKKVQQQDFAAIQKLQKEKEQAEKKVKELIQQLKQNDERKKGKRVPSREIIIEDEADGGDQHENPFADYEEVGDESSPPPHYSEVHALSTPEKSEIANSPSPNRVRPQSAGTTRVSRWSDHAPHQSDSPLFRKSNRMKDDPPKKASSSRHTFDDDSDHNSEDESQRHKEQKALEKWRQSRRKSSDHTNVTTNENKALRQSAFFEEKQKTKAKAEWAAAEAALRLERAKHASPPANLLKRQEEARQKKEEQLRKLKEEMNTELAPEKRVKAREVPVTTYISTESYGISEEQEQLRKERIMKRSTELMQTSKLPSRMALAATNHAQNEVLLLSARGAMGDGEMTPSGRADAGSLSLKMKKKLALEAEEAAKRKAMKPKPVPNFQQLHTKWEKLLKSKSQRNREKATVPQDFFVKNADKYEELKARKLERKKKLEEEEAKKELRKKQDMERLIQKLRSQHDQTSGNSTAVSTSSPKMTKATELRIKTVQKKLLETEKAKEQEQIEDENRKQRQKEAAKRITNEVKRMEERRRQDFTGEYKELNAVGDIAKELAKENHKSFQEAIARNKQNIMTAIATRPSLMERFATDVAKEEAKRSALEAVIKNVFQKNFPVKGILTEEEQYLADEMNAIASLEEKKQDDED